MIEETFTLSNVPTNPTVTLIKRAAEGDRQAMRRLVMELTPVIRTSVATVLARGGMNGRRAARQEVEDATQTVLLALFADRGRVLQQWDPSRGLGLDAFVALLAKREMASLLRSRRRNPWTEDPTLQEDLDQNAVPRMGPESETISRDMLEQLAVAVRSKLTAKGIEIFDLLFMRGLPTEEVAVLTGVTLEAAYAWKSRLTRQVKEILAELATVPPSVRQPSLYDYDSDPGLREQTLETLVRLRRPTPSEPRPIPVARASESSHARAPAPRVSDTGAVQGQAPRRRGGAA
jgi:RNA polymerase sigma-70 factor (ECF subfamily)